MTELLPFVFGMGAADLVLFLVFGALYRREREEHLRAWAWAHALDAARQLLTAAQLSLGGSAVLETTSAFAQALGAWFLLHGAMVFVGRRTHWGWVLAAAAVAAWPPVARALELDFALTQLPTSLFLGAARVAAGVVLLRAGGTRTPRLVGGIALVLWGLHSWNYPFLREVDWFAPWGFTFATLFATCVGIGMLLLHIEHARDAERSAAARFQELFDGAMEGIFRSSTEGRFLAANPALVRMLGYEREEELLELELVRDVYASPADRARILPHEDGGTDTVEVRRRDGSIIEVEVHARRSRDASGAIRWFEGSMRDVTEATRLREELAQAQRLEALGRMAGGIAHDFNNVLGTIVAATELAKVRISRGGDAATELDDVLDSALRAAAMTGQLLTLGRGQPVRRQAIDLRASVGASARVAGRVLGERVRLEVDLGTEPRIVVADGGQLENLVTNLVLNARDAMPEGGVLQLSIDEAMVDGRAHARLRVRDDGIGMSVETRSRMFDPFFTTKPHGGGTGLGLAMVYSAVTQSGGRIEVESAPDAGTRIDVLLPIATGTRAELPPSVPPSRRTSATRQRVVRVLVVEDEPALLRSVTASLQEAGYAVVGVASGAAALAHIDAEAIEVLVTDLVMPGLSGTELARAVREKLPSCGVVYMSGYAADRLDDAMRDDAELLSKPFTIRALLDAVSRRVDQHDARALG